MGNLKLPEMNRVYLSGRLTRDPDVRYLQGGAAVAKGGLAVSRRYNTRDGGKKEDTHFIDFEAWDKNAEFLAEYAKKGAALLIEGSLRVDEWEAQDGSKRTKVLVRADRVQTLEWEDRGDRDGDSRGTQPSHPAADNYRQQRQQAQQEPPAEDDLPF